MDVEAILWVLKPILDWGTAPNNGNRVIVTGSITLVIVVQRGLLAQSVT